MQYLRQVIYLSKYQDGIRSDLAGFCVLREQETLLHLELSLKDFVGLSNIRLGIIFSDESICYAQSVRSPYPSEKLFFRTSVSDIFGSGRSASELLGIVIPGVHGNFYGGRMDDKPLVFRKRIITAIAAEPLSEGIADNIQKSTTDDITKNVAKMSENTVTSNIDQLVEFPPLEPPALPESFTIISCQSVAPEDLQKLQETYPFLERRFENRFLQYGYRQHKRLMLTFVTFDKDSRHACLLGVPGIYSYRDRYMAEMFDFPLFCPAKKGTLCRGTLGYWYKLWNCQNRNL